MAVRRRVGNLATILLQNHLVSQRQREAQQAGFQNQMLEKVLSDPTGKTADRLTRSGVQGFESLVPSQDEAISSVGSEIAGVTDPSKLDDPMSLLAKLKEQPGFKYDPSSAEGFASLINQTNQRRDSINRSAPLVKQDYFEEAPPGVEPIKRERYVNPNFSEPVQTALTGEQEGVHDLAQWQGNEGNAGRINTEVSTAGRKAGAESMARLPAELMMERRRQMDRIELADRARMEERAKLPPALAEKVAGVDTAMFSLDKIEAQYSKPEVQENVGPGAGRMARAREILPFVEPNSPDYAAFAADLSTLNNDVIKAVTGAQMSDPEAKRIMSQVPSKYDKKPDFIAKARATRENMIMLRNKMISLSGSTLPQQKMPEQPYNPDQQGNQDRTPAQQKLDRVRRGQ